MPVRSGEWSVSSTPHGPLVHARLKPGGENTGKLVTLVRCRAGGLAQDLSASLIVLDAPPGIGCPVLSSVAGITLAVAVAEPTLSRIHGLSRVLDAIRHFRVPVSIIINRYDINKENSRQIEEFCKREGMPVVGHIPFDQKVVLDLAAHRPAVSRHDGEAATALREAWDTLQTILYE